jgi:hypothetical protein
MSISSKEAKFNLTFKNLVVYADTSKFFKCCKSKPKPVIKPKEESFKEPEESSYGLMQSLMEEKDDKDGVKDFNEIRDSGMESIHKRITDPEIKNLFHLRSQNKPLSTKYGKPILKNIEGVIYSD